MKLETKNNFPKILVVVSDRINLNDNSNNGLLLRNLFFGWPKNKVLQIYNDGNNGDIGFFDNYYKLSNNDRYFGSFFQQLKNRFKQKLIVRNDKIYTNTSSNSFIINSGFYELFFQPRLSKELKNVINEFNPDIIFYQGYLLSNLILVKKIQNFVKKPLAFFTTDDWPKYKFNEGSLFLKCVSLIPRLTLNYNFKYLLKRTNFNFSFGYLMTREYTKRYNKKFIELNHSDDYYRFENTEGKRIFQSDVLTVVTTGTFSYERWPLVILFSKACSNLEKFGFNIKIVIFSNSIENEGLIELKKYSNIVILDDPGNDLLPAYLKAADLLLLPETLDSKIAKTIELSISSKSHLFMFSRVPIIVFSNDRTGVAEYAKRLNWAKVINTPDINQIADVIKEILLDKNMANNMVDVAFEVACKLHDRKIVNSDFINTLKFHEV